MWIGSTFGRDAAEDGRPRLVRLHRRDGAIRRHARDLRLERDLGEEPDVALFVFQERAVLSRPLARHVPCPDAHALILAGTVQGVARRKATWCVLSLLYAS